MTIFPQPMCGGAGRAARAAGGACRIEERLDGELVDAHLAEHGKRAWVKARAGPARDGRVGGHQPRARWQRHRRGAVAVESGSATADHELRAQGSRPCGQLVLVHACTLTPPDIRLHHRIKRLPTMSNV